VTGSVSSDVPDGGRWRDRRTAAEMISLAKITALLVVVVAALVGSGAPASS
jgi:hypothetical protein